MGSLPACFYCALSFFDYNTNIVGRKCDLNRLVAKGLQFILGRERNEGVL